ncbi:TetR/AcrR family transcriptional regulator [Streptomyces sp. NPDC093228]|uniref:TetR/AcrR family transcriptional regulator n=1 Tax=Streptomyces sp. NPDC093228 TaxID=3155070 RepID=UPI0034121B94
MGVSRQKAAENRGAIISAAEKLFRNRGVDAVGLVELMAAAGLTRGGFYNHFTSKDALVDEVMAKAMRDGLASLDTAARVSYSRGTDALDDQIDFYLSPGHRADLDQGCPNAAFVGDAGRLDEEAQEDYARGLNANLDRFTEIVRQSAHIDDQAEGRALASPCSVKCWGLSCSHVP